MIALVIIPLVFADPNSRKVLVHDESKPSERFAGEDGEGFYSVVQAVYEWRKAKVYWTNSRLDRLVTPCDMPLHSVATFAGSDDMYAIYVEHFSAPSDYDNHFVETPLLSLPAVPEEEGEAEELSDETLNNIERKFFKLLAKDEPDHPWVTGYRSELPLPGSAGGSVTVPLRYDTHDRIVPLE